MLLNKNAILKNTTSYNKSTKPTSPQTSNPNPTPKPVPLSSPTPVSKPKQNIRNYTDYKRVNVNTNTTNQNIPQVFDTYTKYVDLNKIPNTNPEPEPKPNSEPEPNIQTQIEKYVKSNIKEIITQTIKEYIDTHVKTNTNTNANTDTSNEQITNIVKEIIPSILNNAITQNVSKLTSLTNANHILEEKLEEQINTHNDFKSMMEQKHIHLDYQVKDLQKKILVRKSPGSGAGSGQDPHYTLLENKIKELELKIVSLTPDIKI